MSKYKKYQFIAISLALLIFTAVIPTGCQTNTAKKPTLPNITPNAPEVNKYKAEPTITLYRTATGAKQSIKLEQYIKGVVAAEIGDKFPMEALKAQAIVARTLTLALLEYEGGTRGKHNTDASDSHTEFQAYDEKKITPDISRAVDETRGQVLTYQGKFAHALFHAVSKDKTASIQEGFPKLAGKAAAYIVPVNTNGLSIAPAKYRNWTVKIPRSEIKAIMGSKAGTLDDIKISQKGPSGRALTITAGKASISALTLREKVGFDKLYSTMFSSITPQGNSIVFKGSGWGHGCGMEQWGARLMAQQGKKAKEIVTYYLPNTQWTQLYK